MSSVISRPVQFLFPHPDEGFMVALMDATPAMAEELLKVGRGRGPVRRINPQRVNKWKVAMKARGWKKSVQGIQFDWNRNLQGVGTGSRR